MYINKGAKSWFKLNISKCCFDWANYWALSIFPHIRVQPYPRNSWTQWSRKINPDQGHARSSLIRKSPARSKRSRPSSSTGGLMVEQKLLLISTSPSRCGGLTGSLSPPFYLRRKSRGSPKSGKCLETCQSSDLADRQISQLREGNSNGSWSPAAWSKKQMSSFGWALCRIFDSLAKTSLCRH